MTACYPTKRQTCKANRLILLVACNDGPIFVSLNWVLIKPCLCTFEVAHKVIFPTSSNASHQSFISNGLTTLCAIDRNRPTEQTSDNGDDKNNYQHFIFQFVFLDLFVGTLASEGKSVGRHINPIDNKKHENITIPPRIFPFVFNFFTRHSKTRLP